MDYPGSIESRLLEALTSTVPSGRLMLKSRSLTGSLPEIEYVVYDGELYIINRDKTPSTLSVFGLDFTVARVPGEDEGYSYPGLKSGHPFLVSCVCLPFKVSLANGVLGVQRCGLLQTFC